jgi:hypothetical protein
MNLRLSIKSFQTNTRQVVISLSSFSGWSSHPSPSVIIAATVVISARNQVELDTGRAKVPPATAFAAPGMIIDSNFENVDSLVPVSDLKVSGSVQSEVVDEQGNNHQPEII